MASNVTNIDINAAISLVAENNDLATLNQEGSFFANPAFTVDPDLTEEVQRSTLDSFVSRSPKILFTCDYIIDGILIGSLIVWKEDYYATHYEIYKKNAFKEDKFKRICFLNDRALKKERKYYEDYIVNDLGFDELNFNSVRVFLDTEVKKDRIYEYQIRADRVPRDVQGINFEFILKSNDKTKDIVVNRSSQITLKQMSRNIYGTDVLSWIVALTNLKVDFFGLQSDRVPLVDYVDFEGQSFTVLAPRNTDDIFRIYSESISLFGFRDTLMKIINYMGGLPDDIQEIVNNSINDKDQVFSFDAFKNGYALNNFVFSDLRDVFASRNPLSPIALPSGKVLFLPKNQGTTSVASLSDLTEVVNFINNTYVATLYASEPEALSVIQKLKAESQVAEPTPVEKATQELEDAKENYTSATTSENFNLFEVIGALGEVTKATIGAGQASADADDEDIEER